MRLSIYCDGSEYQEGTHNPKTAQLYQGWGVRAHHADRTEELNGGVTWERGQYRARGMYEILAFYHAVLHAESHGYEPHQVIIYTDDSWCVHAGDYLQRAGGHGEKRMKVIKRARDFQRTMFPGDSTALLRLLKWLLHCQVSWVKGHDKQIDNCRVDYLARHGALVKQGKKSGKHVGFNRWTRQQPKFKSSAFLQLPVVA